jgi:hypothetical protein
VSDDRQESDLTKCKQTYASYPYNIYPTLALSNGSLRAYRDSGAWLTNATAVVSGGLLLWFTSALFDHDAARIYTAMEDPNTHRLRVLAAYGVHDRWSLCPLKDMLGQTSVVFNLSAEAGTNLGFDPRRCWLVKIHLVPVVNGEYWLSFFPDSLMVLPTRMLIDVLDLVLDLFNCHLESHCITLLRFPNLIDTNLIRGATVRSMS